MTPKKALFLITVLDYLVHLCSHFRLSYETEKRRWNEEHLSECSQKHTGANPEAQAEGLDAQK